MNTPRGRLPVPEIIAVREDRTEDAMRRRGDRTSSDILSLYLRGGPRYGLDGQMYRFNAPVGILIPRGTYDADQQEGRIDGVFVLFHGHGLVRRPPDGGRSVVITFEGTRVTVPELKELSPADAGELAGMIRQIGAIGDATPAGRMRRVSLLFRAIARYLESGSVGAGRGIHREAVRLRDLITGWAFENAPLKRIYAELELSEDHAGMLFRQAFGLSPVQYRMQLRLARAREMLVSSKVNVSQAAYAVGFADPLYFARAFRQHYGVTPSSLIYRFGTTRK